MRRKSLKAESCPVAKTLDLVGEWWMLLILRDAFAGLRRFSEFQQNLGMSKNVLIARLRKLVDNDVLSIVAASDGSAYHEYVLTEKGKSLFTVMVALRQWGEQHLCTEEGAPVMLVDRIDKQPVRKLEVRSHQGRVLGVEDLQLVSTPG